MAEIKNEYGDAHEQKSFNFERKKGYIETITVRVETEAILTGEQSGKIKDAMNEFVESLKKIAEEF